MMFWIFIILLIESGLLQVLRFDQCHSGWIQVVEGTTNGVLLTCRTNNPSDDLTWSVGNIDPPSNKIELSTCLATSNKCGTFSLPQYKLTRPGNDYSNLELLTPANISFLNRKRFFCSRGSGSDVVCNVDLIYPAAVSSCNIQVVRGEIKWRVDGSCSITKVFSSRGLYACFLMQKQNNSVDVNVANGTYNPTFSAPDALYGSGVCSYTTEFPMVSATYVYSVTVVPGNNITNAGTISVERAETPTSTCETSNIPENSTVICTCQTLSVGKPGGRLLWLLSRTNSVNTVIATGNIGVANLTMESRLTRQDSGLVFQCVVDWATNFTGVQHVTNVNYGPDRVYIPENTTFYTDMTGSLQLNLTCLTTGVKPSSDLVFSWTGPCLPILQNVCTIKPRPPANQYIAYTPQEVKCSVRNPYNNNVSREATYTLDLKYPPSEKPNVTGHPDSGIIYANDILNLTCVINGGNPLVTSMELMCTKHNQTQTSGHFASLSFLVRDDINTTLCVCSGQWTIPSYYTLNNSFQLVVSYPPSTPFILQNGSSKFTYFEGETAYITCSIISSWGNPVAELTWSGQRESNVTISNLPAILQLKYLTWLDNKRNITCQAKNNYTETKNLDIKNSIVLEVYYSPIISFENGKDNQCVLSMDTSQCSIKKSQLLEIICTAQSNPSPANITWRVDNSSGVVVSSNANLSIIADSVAHNIIYVCIVSTESTNFNDSRLPLSAVKELKILITELELVECRSEGLVQLNEAVLDYNFTCTNFLEVDSLTWVVHTLNGSIQAGTCFPNGTCNSLLTAFPIERSSAKISRITVKGPARASGINAITCMAEGTRTVSKICRIDIIYPAEAICTVKSVIGGWHIIGSCNITKVFSSLGNYTCQWFVDTSEETQWTSLSLTTYVPTMHANVNYRQGFCSFTFDLLPNKGIYSYRGVIFPGATSRVLGHVTIEPPQVPNIGTCLPDQFVPSGSTITCTCSTLYIGQPNGRLQWIFNNTPLKVGNYGDTSLQMTTPILGQHDHGSQLFCCVDWIQVSRSVFHTVVVGYQPTILNLTINGTPDSLIVTETASGELLLLCEASGRPTPAVRLLLEGQRELIRQIGGDITHDRSVLKYNLPPKCESAAKYTCYAENGLGSPASSQDILYVMCPPKWITNPIPQSYPSVNFKGAALNITFDVISYPLPNKFSFSYVGTTITANATLTPARVDLFEIKCVLGEVLLAIGKCVLTVKNVQEKDEGYYEAVLINDLGNTRILFQVKVNASEDFASNSSNSSNSTIIAASLTSILVVALTVLVIGFLIRRKKMLCNKGRHTSSEPEESKRIYSENIQPVSSMDNSIINSNESYDILRIQDVGLSSPYEEINQYDVPSPGVSRLRSSQISDPDYENSITAV